MDKTLETYKRLNKLSESILDGVDIDEIIDDWGLSPESEDSLSELYKRVDDYYKEVYSCQNIPYSCEEEKLLARENLRSWDDIMSVTMERIGRSMWLQSKTEIKEEEVQKMETETKYVNGGVITGVEINKIKVLNKHEFQFGDHTYCITCYDQRDGKLDIVQTFCDKKVKEEEVQKMERSTLVELTPEFIETATLLEKNSGDKTIAEYITELVDCGQLPVSDVSNITVDDYTIATEEDAPLDVVKAFRDKLEKDSKVKEWIRLKAMYDAEEDRLEDIAVVNSYTCERIYYDRCNGCEVERRSYSAKTGATQITQFEYDYHSLLVSKSTYKVMGDETQNNNHNY